MTRAHDAVIVAKLRTDPQLTGIVFYDEPIPGTVKKYLRVRTGTGLITAERLAGPLGARTKTYYCTGVATTPVQAAWVLEQVTEQFLNWVPTVAGWSSRRLVLASSQPVIEDPEIDGRFFGVDAWDLSSSPLSS